MALMNLFKPHGTYNRMAQQRANDSFAKADLSKFMYMDTKVPVLPRAHSILANLRPGDVLTLVHEKNRDKQTVLVTTVNGEIVGTLVQDLVDRLTSKGYDNLDGDGDFDDADFYLIDGFAVINRISMMPINYNKYQIDVDLYYERE